MRPSTGGVCRIGIVCAVSAACSSASAQFTIVSVDAGGFWPFTTGEPLLAPKGSGFFVEEMRTGGSADPVAHDILTPIYGDEGVGLSMVGIQPSAPTHVPLTNGPLGFAGGVNPVQFVPQTATNTVTIEALHGYWYSLTQIQAGAPVTKDGLAAVWISRLTVAAGDTIDLSSARLKIGISEDGVNDKIVTACAQTVCVLGVSHEGGPAEALAYYLRLLPVLQTEFADVYDLMIEQVVIPAPAMLSVLAFGALATTRRR